LPVIEADKISKYYGEFEAVKDVSFTVEKGEILGCFGPNGAGKTTLIKILTGQLHQSSGNASVLGIDISEDPIELKRRIGIVPEFESPPTYLTGNEFLNFVGEIRKLSDASVRTKYWIKFFNLEQKGQVITKEMSKGMRQMLMLAAAFLHDPPLLFLDEPFINLDPIYQEKVRKYLLKYVKNGGTILMCTHILEIAERMCTRIAIMNEGRIIARGTIEGLRKKKGEDLNEIFIRLVREDKKKKVG